MAESVGSVFYTVDAQTDGLIDSSRQADAALDRLQQTLDRTDSAATRTNRAATEAGKSISGTGRAANDASSGLSKLLNKIDPLVSKTQELDHMTEELGRHFDAGRVSAADYERSLAKLDQRYKDLDGSSKKADDNSRSFGSSLKPLAAAVAAVITLDTLKTWGKMAEQFTLLQARITRLSADTVTAAANYQALLNIAAGTGQSLAATEKLWESLTANLKSLGATNTEVLALTGTLQKIGKLGGSSSEEIANAMRQLGQSLAGGIVRAEEFNSIVEQTPELARQLAAGLGLSMGELRQRMLEGKLTAEDVLTAIQKQAGNVDTEFKKLPRSASDAANAVTIAFGAAVSALDKALGASQALAKGLDGLAGVIRRTSNTQGLEELNADLAEAEATLARYTDAKTGQVSAMFTEDAAALTQQIAQLKARQKLLTVPTPATAPARVKPTTSIDGQKGLKELREQTEALRVQGVERAKILAVQKLGATATDEEKKKAQELAAQIYNLQEGEKARNKSRTEGTNAAKKAQKELQAEILKAAEAEEKGVEKNVKKVAELGEQLDQTALSARQLAMRQAELSLNEYATPDQIAKVKELAGAIYDMRQTMALSKQAGQDLPSLGAAQTYEDDLKRYQEYRNAQLITDQQYMALRDKAETDYEAKRKAIQEQTFKNAATGNALLLNGIDALTQGATQSLSSILSGTGNLRDALGNIAQTVLSTVIGSFVQMGADWVKQQIIMQSTAAATTATQTGGIATVAAAQNVATGTIAATTTTAAATTGAAVAGSMAPAAGLSSIASFGGAAVIGGAALLATMALAKSAGGRALGGPVGAGNMYRINETGAPEVFNAANGRQYMLPNTRGDVVSNRDATAGAGAAVGAAPVVNVHNYNGSSVRQQSSMGANKQQIIDIFVEDMAKGGRTSQMVNATTGTKRQGTR